MKSKYLDWVTLFLTSGRGGDGSASFRREKFVPRGGPDGGDGGKGGDIIFRIDRTMFTLNHLRYKHHFKAEDAGCGMQQKKHGKDGSDVVIPVPPGTVILDNNGEELLEMIEGDYIFLKGGKGGKGNTHFKSATNRSPRKIEKGKEGSYEEITLELRLIADIGLLGLPNAGKSTFLKSVTHANPKIADYPFTTLEPNLGILSDGVKIIRIADIPGIIEGASEGKGLGNRFLKHISRVSVILFVIDITDKNPLETFTVLSNELASYDKKLSRKRKMIIFNKIDLVSDHEKLIKGFENLNVKYTFASLINNNNGGIEDLLFAEMYGRK